MASNDWYEKNAHKLKKRKKNPANASVLSCELCNIFNLGADALASHKNGKAHKTKQSQASMAMRNRGIAAAEAKVMRKAAGTGDEGAFNPMLGTREGEEGNWSPPYDDESRRIRSEGRSSRFVNPIHSKYETKPEISGARVETPATGEDGVGIADPRQRREKEEVDTENDRARRMSLPTDRRGDAELDWQTEKQEVNPWGTRGRDAERPRGENRDDDVDGDRDESGRKDRDERESRQRRREDDALPEYESQRQRDSERDRPWSRARSALKDEDDYEADLGQGRRRERDDGADDVVGRGDPRDREERGRRDRGRRDSDRHERDYRSWDRDREDSPRRERDWSRDRIRRRYDDEPEGSYRNGQDSRRKREPESEERSDHRRVERSRSDGHRPSRRRSSPSEDSERERYRHGYRGRKRYRDEDEYSGRVYRRGPRSESPRGDGTASREQARSVDSRGDYSQKRRRENSAERDPRRGSRFTVRREARPVTDEVYSSKFERTSTRGSQRDVANVEGRGNYRPSATSSGSRDGRRPYSEGEVRADSEGGYSDVQEVTYERRREVKNISETVLEDPRATRAKRKPVSRDEQSAATRVVDISGRDPRASASAAQSALPPFGAANPPVQMPPYAWPPSSQGAYFAPSPFLPMGPMPFAAGAVPIPPGGMPGPPGAMPVPPVAFAGHGLPPGYAGAPPSFPLLAPGAHVGAETAVPGTGAPATSSPGMAQQPVQEVGMFPQPQGVQNAPYARLEDPYGRRASPDSPQVGVSSADPYAEGVPSNSLGVARNETPRNDVNNTSRGFGYGFSAGAPKQEPVFGFWAGIDRQSSEAPRVVRPYDISGMMNINTWKDFESSMLAVGGASALAFKVLRDVLLSPNMGLAGTDVEVLNEIMSRVPAYTDDHGSLSIQSSAFPRMDMATFGQSGLQNEQELSVVNRLSDTVNSSLVPAYHHQNEEERVEIPGEELSNWFNNDLNTLITGQFGPGARYPVLGSLYGRSCAIGYEIEASDVHMEGRGREVVNFNLSSAGHFCKAAAAKNSVARDPTFASLQNGSFRVALQRFLDHMAAREKG